MTRPSAVTDSHPQDDVFGAPDLPKSFDEAVLLIDKARGRTSFDVVRDVRRLTGQKVGHAGTLDPNATGLLILLVGRATKRMESFMNLSKTYTGVMRLGEVTPSYDTETEVTERREWRPVTDGMVEEAFASFTGTIEQVPPMYSAVKIGGERLYKKARRGETVKRRPRIVDISAFEVTDRDGQDVAFRVKCSKGTYIRSLARDVGEKLEVGAHLVELRRTAIGPYGVEEAWTIDQLTTALT